MKSIYEKQTQPMRKCSPQKKNIQTRSENIRRLSDTDKSDHWTWKYQKIIINVDDK